MLFADGDGMFVDQCYVTICQDDRHCSKALSLGRVQPFVDSAVLQFFCACFSKANDLFDYLHSSAFWDSLYVSL